MGAGLAVMLTLYLRVSDQIKDQERNRTGNVAETGASSEGESGQREYRSYEEIYAAFLTAMEGYAVSERELEVAWLLYRGYTNRQIGEELYIEVMLYAPGPFHKLVGAQQKVHSENGQLEDEGGEKAKRHRVPHMSIGFMQYRNIFKIFHILSKSHLCFLISVIKSSAMA